MEADGRIWWQSMRPGTTVRYGQQITFVYWEPDCATKKDTGSYCNGQLARGYP